VIRLPESAGVSTPDLGPEMLGPVTRPDDRHWMSRGGAGVRRAARMFVAR